MELLPAFIPNNKAALESNAQLVCGFSSLVHLDVTDGVFDPAVSWPCGEGQWEELEKAERIPGCEDLEVMVHLMVSDPERIGVLFARAGATRISAHLESFQDADEFRRVVGQWKQVGVQKVGVVLLLDTPLTRFDPVADSVDFVQLMSIAHVGFQKQSFEEGVFDRIRTLHAKYPLLPIAIDGGVSKENIRALQDAGATIFIVGSAIMSAPNPQDAYHEIQRAV